jgi:hypothetical protein
MADLDLDIGNYTIRDIEAFFKFKPNTKYSASDIETRETVIREQLLQSGHINKRMKRDLISFLTAAKEWLTVAKCGDEKKAPTTLPPNPRLDNLNYPRAPMLSEPRTDDLIQRKDIPYVNTYKQEYVAGWMNPLVTKTINKCIVIDSRFRDKYYNTSSSDFTIQLPLKLNKVVSMQLTAIEFPVSFYGITQNGGNNYMFLEISHTDPSGNPRVDSDYLYIADGNYNAQELISTINTVLRPVNADGTLSQPNSIFSYIQFFVDLTDNGSGTGRVFLTTTADIRATEITNIRLDFSIDPDGSVFEGDISTRLGWNLGFQKRSYDGAMFHISETVIEPLTIRYLYLAIDDFNNSVNNHFITVFKDNILSPDIIARISLRGSYFSLIMEDVVSEPRKYFGPVDIQKLRIRVFDDKGRILDTNHSNFSFCLSFKLLYDV